MNDNVKNPLHYTQGEIECIDAIRAALSPDEFIGGLRWQVFKYLWRYKHKGTPVEDLNKASQYLSWLIEETEGQIEEMGQLQQEIDKLNVMSRMHEGDE